MPLSYMKGECSDEDLMPLPADMILCVLKSGFIDGGASLTVKGLTA